MADPASPLQNVSLFSHLSQSQQAEVAALMVEEQLKAGQRLFTQGEPGDRLYVVVSGRMRIFVASPNGDEMVLATPGPNEVFGELALLDSQPRSASVEAEEKSKLLSLSREAFLDALAKNRALTEGILVALAASVRRLTDQTADVVFHDVNERVARLLVRLAEEKRAAGEETVELDRRTTQNDVATIIGRSSQSVNDILRSFEHLGCLSLYEDKIVVRDLERLERQVREGMSWSELTEQVYHDPLTKLGNRALFHERVVSAVTNAMRSGRPAAVLFLDLDGFKAVNDTYGHAAGDRLLQVVGERVSDCVRKSDTVARLGGDEFAVVLEDMVSGDAATVVAQRIIEKMRKSIPLDGNAAKVGTSIGISVFQAGNRVLPDELIQQADAAMYAAKTSGKGRYVIHGDEAAAQAIG